MRSNLQRCADSRTIKPIRMMVVAGDQAALKRSCDNTEIAEQSSLGAGETPLPRERIRPSFEERFGFAFLPGGLTPGVRNLAHSKSLRPDGPNRRVLAAVVVPLPRERPVTSFAERFGYAFLPADQTPREQDACGKSLSSRRLT